jgi:hypothetical protein
MSIRYFPRVRDGNHHEYLQRLIRGYPTEPYRDWLIGQEKTMAIFRGSGGDAYLVDFTYHQFTDYCQTNNRTIDFDAFKDFIFWKGSNGAVTGPAGAQGRVRP